MKRKRLWVVGVVSIALVVAAGLYFFALSPNETTSEKRGKDWCNKKTWNSNIDRWVDADYELVGPKTYEELPRDVLNVASISMYGINPCSLFHSSNSLPEYADERIGDMGVEIWAYSILRWGPEPMIATLGSAKALGPSFKASNDAEVTRFPGGLEDNIELLATAISTATDTDQDNHISPQWTERLLEVGRTKFLFADEKTSRVDYGWTVFAPLLRKAEYSTEFLSTVSIDILKFDKKSRWKIDDNQSGNPYDEAEPDDLNPVTPVLDALKANKDAAKKVAEATGDERVEKLVKG